MFTLLRLSNQPKTEVKGAEAGELWGPRESNLRQDDKRIRPSGTLERYETDSVKT